MAIVLVGDTHADIRRFSSDNFPFNDFTKDDYVIILGDFGLVWDNEESPYETYWLNWLEEKPWTTLFIDGNHENFDRLNSYPIEYWNGGKVQRIRPSIMHLMRGQVFELQGKKFFTFGGASSHDIQDGVLEVGDPRIKEWSKDRFKLFRVNKVSWWEQELPTKEEMNEGVRNLINNAFNVDYVLTHCAPASITTLIGKGLYENDVLTNYLEQIRGSINFKKWYCGHYHINHSVNPEFTILYEKFDIIW